jgi:hypothetical protein
MTAYKKKFQDYSCTPFYYDARSAKKHKLNTSRAFIKISQNYVMLGKWGHDTCGRLPALCRKLSINSIST